MSSVIKWAKIVNKQQNKHMKYNLTKCSIYAVLLLSLGLLIGCTAIDKAYNKEVVYTPAKTNTVTTFVTNTVVIAAVTNADQTVTPEKTQVVIVPTVEYTVVPATYKTNLVDNPSVTTTLAVAETLPVPYAGLVASIIALAYASYRNVRNKKALVAVVQGIDAGRKLLQNTPELRALDAKIKDVLIDHQEVAGVLQAVTKVVTEYTGDTVPPAS